MPARRRRWPALLAGAVGGVVLAGVVIAARLGHLDPVLPSVLQAPLVEPTATPAPTTRARVAAKAKVQIRSTPTGADVFEITASGHRLLGIAPLTVAWDIAAGDPSRVFLLKLEGYVPSRATLDPPEPSPTGDPVVLEVNAPLRVLRTP